MEQIAIDGRSHIVLAPGEEMETFTEEKGSWYRVTIKGQRDGSTKIIKKTKLESTVNNQDTISKY